MKSKCLGWFQPDPSWIPTSSLTTLPLISYLSTSWLFMVQLFMLQICWHYPNISCSSTFLWLFQCLEHIPSAPSVCELLVMFLDQPQCYFLCEAFPSFARQSVTMLSVLSCLCVCPLSKVFKLPKSRSQALVFVPSPASPSK